MRRVRQPYVLLMLITAAVVAAGCSGSHGGREVRINHLRLPLTWGKASACRWAHGGTSRLFPDRIAGPPPHPAGTAGPLTGR